MMRVMRFLTPLLLLLAAAGCATPFQSNVSRFHAIDAVPTQATFIIQPRDMSRAGGLEFQTYARQVAARMIALGFRETGDPAAAQLVVVMDYGVNDGRERIASRPGVGPTWGAWGWSGYGFHSASWRRSAHWGWYDPFFWGPGWGWGWSQPEVYSFTEFTSHLDLSIKRADGSATLFEGRAEARTRNNDLTRLVPGLVQAMFTGFPGNSGETVRVSIDDQGRATSRPARNRS
jgi:hypothetical protein